MCRLRLTVMILNRYLLPSARSAPGSLSDEHHIDTKQDVVALAQDLMHEWDTDGDEQLTDGEFHAALESLLSRDASQEALLEEELTELYKVIDVDQDGLITARELHTVVFQTLVRAIVELRQSRACAVSHRHSHDLLQPDTLMARHQCITVSSAMRWACFCRAALCGPLGR